MSLKEGSKRYPLSFPPGLKKRAEDEAQAAGRTLNNWIVRLIEGEVARMLKERFAQNRNAVVGMAWAEVDALNLDWQGFWPVVDELGVIHSTVDGNDDARALEKRGITYDEQADIYHIDLGRGAVEWTHEANPQWDSSGTTPGAQTQGGFTMMTPSEAWDGFVGSQTPDEFVELNRQNGLTDIDQMCATYALELPHMFYGTWDDSNDLNEIATLLAQYIRHSLAAE